MVYELSDYKKRICVKCKLSTVSAGKPPRCQMFIDEIYGRPVLCSLARNQAGMCGQDGKHYAHRDESE